MRLELEHHGQKYFFLTESAHSLAIQMDFDGPQPNHFGSDKASSEVLKLGDFTCDTSAGGSCNVDVLKIIPHCNGTHTETVGHIINEDIWVGHAAMDVLTVAMLITVPSMPAKDCKETYRPALDFKSDDVITSAAIKQAIASVGSAEQILPGALIIRTLPNENEKTSRAYTAEKDPPFLTVEAMELVNQTQVKHLLLDVPSVDKMYDDGLLTNHHLFWQVKEGTHSLSDNTRQDKTITEMIFVDNEIKDGLYALNLQVPAFCSDAAPSRPVITPLTKVS